MAEIPMERFLEIALLKAINCPDLDVTGKTDDEIFQEIENTRGYNEPGAHIKADGLIAKVMSESLGYDRVARIFRSMPKWYE